MTNSRMSTRRPTRSTACGHDPRSSSGSIRPGPKIGLGSGGVAEWTNAVVLKTAEVRASVGSNPTPSASAV
jgi:hypothetical protein